jgi:arylsulfatase A-like enzyme
MNFKKLFLLTFFLVILTVPLYYSYLYLAQIILIKGVQRPDVLLVTIDTFHYGAMGAYGNPDVYTPFMDSLSRESILFPRSYASVPTTGPSHTTILTGRKPATHRVFRNAMKYSNDYVTLPKVFQDAGYKTAAFISGYSLCARVSGLEKGFDFYDDGWSASQLERDAADTIQSCTSWLNQNGSQPFFAWLHLFDPHAPYEERSPFIRGLRAPDQPIEQIQVSSTQEQTRRYSDNVEKALQAGDFMVLVSNPMTTQTDSETMLKNWTAYLSEISYLDFALAEFRRNMAEMDKWNRTLILLTSDHGEGFDHDYYFAHGDRLWESALHVPFIVRFPLERVKGSLAHATALHEDIFPTTLSICNIDFPVYGLEGADLKKTMELNLVGANSSWTAIAPPLPRKNLSNGLIVATYDSVFKLIRTVDSQEELFFRLSDDPGESKELGDQFSSVKQQLSTRLDDFLSTGNIPHTVIFDPGEIQEEESLRSLGYIQ